MWALDPSTLPAERNVSSAVRGIDLVLILDGWDEGPTRLAPMPVPQAIQSLAEQSALWSDNHGVTLRNIAALLSNAPCYRLIRHHGDTGADTVEELVASCVTPGT